MVIVPPLQRLFKKNLQRFFRLLQLHSIFLKSFGLEGGINPVHKKCNCNGDTACPALPDLMIPYMRMWHGPDIGG